MKRLWIGLTLVSLAMGCGSEPEPGRRVIVLGFDGMDPNILQGFMDSGDCPNMKKLAQQGSFKPLGTSNPPQSPVAWTNFITGMNPGGHGIFDFAHRDPETYLPLNSGEISEEVTFALSPGDYYLPIMGGSSENSRRGVAFWDLLADEDIPTYIHRMPANFPPTDSDAVTYTGMNTPDIRPSAGTYAYYTSRIEDESSFSRGDFIDVEYRRNVVITTLTGPSHPLKPEADPIKTTLKIFTDPERKIAKVEVSGQEMICRLGELSDWVPVSFEVIPNLLTVGGICRFLIKEMDPEFRMYVSPINIDPMNPVAPVSTPEDASTELAEAVGPYYTQGIPADYSALKEGALTDGEFLMQSNAVFEEETKIFDFALDQCRSGFLYLYFSSSDMISHNLWRHQDKKHPYHDPTLAPEYQRAIRDIYHELDVLVGKLMAQLKPDDTLIIMSDHGFCSFSRAFSVNKWLVDKGYLVLNPLEDGQPADSIYGGEKEDGTPIGGANWAKSKAYTIGFNGIYLNRKGREAQGIVQDKEREALEDRIIAELEGLVDPQTGEAIFRKVWRAKEAYQGAHVDNGPDLLLGYASGFGTSDNAAKGSLDEELIFDNMSTWSGSHLVDPREVPGILLSNKKITHEDPKLYDVTVGVLEEFGLKKSEGMIGSGLFKSDSQ